MEWLTFLLVVIIIITLIKQKKHEWARHGARHLFVIIILLLILTISAYYVDIDKFFNKENTLSQTGAAVVETFNENIDISQLKNFVNLDGFIGKSKESMDNGIDDLQKDLLN